MRFAYVSGKDTSQRRKRIVAAFKDGQIDVLISSVILEEGFDFAGLEFLILAGGGKAEHRQVQRIGRGMRVAEGKASLTVIDFMDKGKWLGEHSRQRAKAYRKERAYTIHELTAAEVRAL